MAQLVHYIKTAWKFLMTYTIPPGVKGAWNPVRAVVSLGLAPFVLISFYGCMMFSTQSQALSRTKS